MKNKRKTAKTSPNFDIKKHLIVWVVSAGVTLLLTATFNAQAQYACNTYTTLGVPGSIQTFAYSVPGNNSVEAYANGSNIQGFPATLVPERWVLVLLGVGVAAFLVRRSHKTLKTRIPIVGHFAGRIRVEILLSTLWLVMFANSRVLANGFNSGIVDFNFNFSSSGYPAYGPGPAAIGSVGDLWNTASLGQGLYMINLYTTDGGSTSLQWDVSSGGGQATAVGGTYGSLFDVNCAFASASISGLTPNQSYNLYLYSSVWDEVISVNGTEFTTYGVHSGTTVDTLIGGSNYDVHTVTADSAGTLSFNEVSAQFGTPYLSSWQLTPVPEPSVLALLIGSAAALLVRDAGYYRALKWVRQCNRPDSFSGVSLCQPFLPLSISANRFSRLFSGVSRFGLSTCLRYSTASGT